MSAQSQIRNPVSSCEAKPPQPFPTGPQRRLPPLLTGRRPASPPASASGRCFRELGRYNRARCSGIPRTTGRSAVAPRQHRRMRPGHNSACARRCPAAASVPPFVALAPPLPQLLCLPGSCATWSSLPPQLGQPCCTACATADGLPLASQMAPAGKCRRSRSSTEP